MTPMQKLPGTADPWDRQAALSERKPVEANQHLPSVNKSLTPSDLKPAPAKVKSSSVPQKSRNLALHTLQSSRTEEPAQAHHPQTLSHALKSVKSQTASKAEERVFDSFLASVPGSAEKADEQHLIEQVQGQRHALNSRLFKIKKRSILGEKDCLGRQSVLKELERTATVLERLKDRRTPCQLAAKLRTPSQQHLFATQSRLNKESATTKTQSRLTMTASQKNSAFLR